MWAWGVLCVRGLPISGNCGRPGALRLEAAICQLTLGRHGNQNALRRVQSVPPQVELWEGCHHSAHTLFLFLLSSSCFCNIIAHSSPSFLLNPCIIIPPTLVSSPFWTHWHSFPILYLIIVSSLHHCHVHPLTISLFFFFTYLSTNFEVRCRSEQVRPHDVVT